MMRLPFILVAALLATGCGGPPQPNPHLEEARRELETLSNDTLTVRYAPVALKKAEETLAKSEKVWNEKGPKVQLEHQAYLAKQQARIAAETARIKAAEVEVERAELDRKEVQLDVRQKEAEKARKQAEEAQRQAEAAQRRAQQAQQRIKDLATQLEELEAQQTERGIVLTLKDVLFDFGKAELKSGGRNAVSKVAEFLKEYPERRVLVEGHTDNIGSDAYNQTLSLQRAESVKQALIGFGTDAGRIEIRGFGESHPVATNDTDAGRQRNRRVEIVFSDEEGNLSERND